MTLLALVLMAVIGTAHADERVAKASLGNVGTNASAAQERARRSTTVMQRPAGDAGRRVKRSLAFGESGPSTRAGHAEDKVAVAEMRLRRDNFPRRLRQRDQRILARFVTRTRDNPRVSVKKLAPPQARRLAPTRGRQQHEAHEGTEWSLVLLGRHPHVAHFVIE